MESDSLTKACMRFVILGEPVSKANSREFVLVGPKDKKRVMIRKSDKAIAYERAALRQIPMQARMRLEGPVRCSIRMFYASERPDLDASIVLDVLQDRWGKTSEVVGQRPLMQAGVYRNDRQVRELHLWHAVDASNPRAEIEIQPLQPQQSGLDLDDVTSDEALAF